MERTTHITALRTLVAGAFVAAMACGQQQPDLEPAPAANAVPGIGQGAAATEAGVRVEARVDAWQWRPENLEVTLTPILVEVTNSSGRPLLIRYGLFELTNAAGRSFAALPPYSLDQSVTQAYTVESPFYPMAGFEVAPYLSPYYPLVDPYAGAFAFDPLYYDPYVTRFREIQLPTAEMVQRALPEGVLESGGRVAGFLYFEDVGADVQRLMFEAELVDARTNQRFAVITIPFVGGN